MIPPEYTLEIGKRSPKTEDIKPCKLELYVCRDIAFYGGGSQEKKCKDIILLGINEGLLLITAFTTNDFRFKAQIFYSSATLHVGFLTSVTNYSF